MIQQRNTAQLLSQCMCGAETPRPQRATSMASIAGHARKQRARHIRAMIRPCSGGFALSWRLRLAFCATAFPTGSGISLGKLAQHENLLRNTRFVLRNKAQLARDRQDGVTRYQQPHILTRCTTGAPSNAHTSKQLESGCKVLR